MLKAAQNGLVLNALFYGQLKQKPTKKLQLVELDLSENSLNETFMIGMFEN